MTKFSIFSIFVALFLFKFATSFEIVLSLSPTPSPKHKIPASQHISHLTPKNALENPLSPHSIPKVEIVYPLSKSKVSPKPSPNKSLPSHLAPKSSTITTDQSHSSWGQMAPKSSIKRNISPKPIEKYTSNSILAPHSHVFSSKPIHSTTKVTKTSPSKSRLAPRPTPKKYLPTHLAPKISISKQILSPKPSSKPTRNHGSKFFQVRPKVGSHFTTKQAKKQHIVSPQPTPITYKQKVNPKLAAKSTRKFSLNTHLAPKSTVTKPNSLLSPTSKIITKSHLAPMEAPNLTHKLTPKHGTH
ncbi:extensin-like [Lycium ferocissimum]|uniref:extensin-like n=1 Tax=Lycium ferocissimum TaxID=112874 RepID=UPI0028169A3C|nr:extensin-like [Lycium ferocissimum]